MAVTVQEIFDISIHLMDAQNESTGNTETADTKEYRLRTISLLNSILDRAFPYSDNYREALEKAAGRRPVCPKVSVFTQTVDLDDRVCTSALPYGLAALFLLEEDPTRADFFWQTFLENLELCRQGLPAVISEVEDVYGGIEHGEFGAWT